MMLAEDLGQAVSGAAIDYLPNRWYWINAGKGAEIAKVVMVGGKLKWKLMEGEPRAFVDLVYRGPIEEP